MSEMEPAISRKLPARIVDTRHPTLILTAAYHQKAALLAEVRRMSAAGRVRVVDVRPVWSPTTGRWEQRVVQLRPEPPAWRRPLLIGAGISAAFGAMIVLVWWLLASLAALPLGVICVAAAVALGVAMRSGRQATVTITQHNYVKVDR